MLAALGRGIARRPGLIVVIWLLATIAGFAAATGVLGEGLFARLAAGEPTVSSESSEGRAILNSASTTGPSVSLMVQNADPADPVLVAPLTAAREDNDLSFDKVEYEIKPAKWPWLVHII